MFNETRYKPFNEYAMTSLELEGRESLLEIKLISQLGKRERRALIRSLLVALKPTLRHFTRAAIDHTGDGLIHDRRAHLRGVKIFKDGSIGTTRGNYRFEIRMRRLKRGWTQAELAGRIEIQRSHLSDIERGLYFPHPKTQKELEKALN